MATRSLTYVIMGQDRLTPVLQKAGKEAEGTSAGIMSGFTKAGIAAMAAAAVIGGVLTKVIKDARAEGWSPLSVAAKDAGISIAGVTSQAKTAGGAFAKLGFDQGQVNASLTKLITSTGSQSVSFKALSTAADLARYKHIDLATASDTLARAASGNTRALATLGIATSALPKNFKSTGDAASRTTTVLDLMNKKIGGQASAYADTFGGKLAAVKAQITNLSGGIGMALLPILSQLLTVLASNIMPVLQTFSAWFIAKGIPAIKNFGREIAPLAKIVFKDFSAGVKAIVEGVTKLPGPMKIAGLAVVALGVAMKLAAMANPWLLLATAIILIVGLVVSHWNTIKTVTLAVFGAIHDFIFSIWASLHAKFGVELAAIGMIWRVAWTLVSNTFRIIWAAISAYVKVGWDIITAIFKVAIALLTGNWSAAWNAIRNVFIQIWNAIATFWRTAMSAFTSAVTTALSAVVGFFGGLGRRILSAVGNFGSLLVNIGGSLVSGLYHGITSALSNVGNWIKANIFDPIVSGIKSLFGIHSPSTVMAGIGGNLVKGLILGLIHTNPSQMIGKVFGDMPTALAALIGKGLVNIAKLPASALKALGSVAGKIGGFFSHLFGGGGGSGVGQWKSLVDIALMLNGLPSSMDSRVLYQMQTESGGNPNAINLTDSNAAAGDPSRGLLQTIMSTFMAYHIPGTSFNIYDPLANIAAAINYAKARYGPSLMSGGMGMGSGHGYAAGTASARRGWAWVGEGGRPELIHFNGGEQVGPMVGGRGAVVYQVNVTVAGHALASKQEIGRTVADALQAFRGKGGKT